MNIQRIIKRSHGERKSILLTIRITPRISQWLREKNYSPTGLFYEAIRELGYDAPARDEKK